MTETRPGADIEASSGQQLEPGGRAPAPGRLALVQRFVNTWNHEFPIEQDRLGTTRAATRWLHEQGLDTGAARPSAMTAGDLGILRELREAIRALAAANVTGSCDPSVVHEINDVAAAAPLIFAIDDDGRSNLRTRAPGVQHVVGTLLTIIHEAQIAGDWARLKGCRQCEYAFYDSSKNRSATWCSMSICGNRAKNRTYHQRQRNRTQP